MKAALALFLSGLLSLSEANDTNIDTGRKLTVKDVCNTEDLSVEEMEDVDKAIARYRKTSKTPLQSANEKIVVKVAWHQIKSSNSASTNYDRSTAEKSIQILNDAFAGREALYSECSNKFTYEEFSGTPFVFELTEYIEDVNNGAFNLDSSTSSTYRRNVRKGDCSTLNIYTGQTNYLGFAYFPNSCPSNGDYTVVSNTADSVVIHYGSLPDMPEFSGQYDEGDTLTHEVGHWFGLYHTFQSGCSGGDQVADTPPEASPHFGCNIGRDTCGGGGVDPIHNFMDYSDDCCMYRFSDDQIERMIIQGDIYRGLKPEPSGSPTKFPSATPTGSPKTDSPTNFAETDSPSRSPTTKLPTSSGPTTYNEAEPLSWSIDLKPPPSATENSSGDPVLQLLYEISNRNHFMHILGPDCERDVSAIFELEYKDSPASTQGFLDLNADIIVNKEKLEEDEIWIPAAVGGSFSFCLSTALYKNDNIEDANIVTKKDIIFKVAVNNIALFDMNVETFVPVVEENDDLDISYSGTVDACQCDDSGCLPVPPELGPFDILRVCIWEVDVDDEVIVRAFNDLKVYQASSGVTFDAVQDGAIPGGNEELVVTDCTPSTGSLFKQCEIKIQLISVFFTEINGIAPGNLQISGSAFLGATGGRSSRNLVNASAFRIDVHLKEERVRGGIGGFMSSLMIMLPCLV